ncbi:MAG: hypothetical protein AB2535_19085 [Candidatus Thiodiazotropha endolucinida]
MAVSATNFIWEDDGDSWSELAAPAYPEKPDGLEDKDPFRELEIPWNTQMIWSLEAGIRDEIWCGVIPGGLFRSIDNGDSWTFIDALWNDPRRKQWMGGGFDFAGIHSILVDPRDPAHVTVGVSVGGVWTSMDSGVSWQLIGEDLRSEYMPPEQAGDPLTQDPHRIVQCATNPDRLWMQHHNGIFVSDDAGHHWRELSDVKPSNFGFAVVVDPKDPDTAWFIPAKKDEQHFPVDAKLLVNHTTDAGASFQSLRQGLPPEPAYDLVYRHTLDIDGEGDRLAFGSTTGSLWISEDRGDHWQAVSYHLPPVNCLRFEN